MGKTIVATGFEKLPKVQLIAQSGHTAGDITTVKRGMRAGPMSCLLLYAYNQLTDSKMNGYNVFWAKVVKRFLKRPTDHF